jgi:hypothetical protein
MKSIRLGCILSLVMIAALLMGKAHAFAGASNAQVSPSAGQLAQRVTGRTERLGS